MKEFGDKMICKKWLYLERNTLHRECGPSQKERAREPENMMWVVCMGWIISQANELGIIPAILWKGWGFPGIGPPATFWPSMVGLRTVKVLVGVSFSMLSYQEEKGMTEDEMVGWYHQLDGHELEQAPRVGDRQGSLACCSPWGRKEWGMTEWLNWYYHEHIMRLKVCWKLAHLPSWT